MKKIAVLFVLAAQVTFGNDFYWSKTGHRVIGEVAENHLSGKAKRAIHKLLGGQSLSAVSNYADEIKADRSFNNFSAWHYVNFPADKKYSEVEPSTQGDIVTGIQECIRIVKDETSTRADKIFYLKMLIHLVGDLHQPMHVGRLEDKGGNDIQVRWFGRGSNLHRVWDTNMINDYGLSYTELSVKLPEIGRKEIQNIQSGNVLDWVEESQELANGVYNSAESGQKLGYAYSYKYWSTVELQLQKGGLRLAKILNELFR